MVPALRQVRLPGQQARNGNVFIQRIPVQATFAQLYLGALLGRGFEQTRKPGQGCGDGATIRKADPHGVVIESNRFRRSVHDQKFVVGYGLCEK